MNAINTRQMSPRAQRFMRELDGFDAASTARALSEDPEVRRWKRVSAIVSIGVAACFVALLAVIGLYAPPAAAQVSGPGACGVRAVDNESFLTCDGDTPAPQFPAPDTPSRAITAAEAWQMKRALGPRMVLIDIRGSDDIRRSGVALGTDVSIPFIDQDAGTAWTQFNGGFLRHSDAVLRAARLDFDAPIVLLCQSGQLGRVAAELMAEHGYQQVYIVADGFDGSRGGWKQAGLPWIELPHGRR